MEIYQGVPVKTGWYFNIIPRTGLIDNNPENFIGLWTDYFDKSTSSWLIHKGIEEFWAKIPNILDSSIMAGQPKNIGVYLLLFSIDDNKLPWYFPSNINKNKLKSLKRCFHSDRVVKGFPSNTLTICENEEAISGYIHLPELLFPHGKAVKYPNEYTIAPKLGQIKSTSSDGKQVSYKVDKDYEHKRYERELRNNRIRVSNIPKNILTEQLCVIAVEVHGNALQGVPENFRSEKVIRTAIENYGNALRFLSEDQRTLEICELAVKSYPNSLQYVPVAHRTIDICRISIEGNGLNLRHVPSGIRNENLCSLAIQNNPNAIRYVKS